MTVKNWKVQGGPLIDEPILLVYRRLSESQMDQVMEKVKPLKFISFRGSRPLKSDKPKSYPQPTRLELIGLSESSTRDKDLLRLKADTIAARRAGDALFGLLTYDELWKQYFGKGDFHGSKVTYFFKARNITDLELLISLAAPLWKVRRRWFKAWRETVCDLYLTNAQKRWTETKPLTRAEFLRQLPCPTYITFSLKKGRFAYKLQGCNDKLFRPPGVLMNGSTMSDFEIAKS